MWLDEIEKELEYCSGEKGIYYLCYCVKRMTRVIRELVKVVKHIEFDERYGDIMYKPPNVIEAMENLSDDTKKVIECQK